MIIDRDGTRKDQTLAIVVAELDRMIEAERARALLLPHRIRTRHGRTGARGRYPTELGIKSVWCAGRRQQHDRGRIGIDGFAVLLKRQIVEPATLEVDAAG